MRKVLMTADTLGGVWTYSIDLIREFSARGVHVLLATLGRPLSEAQRQEVSVIPRLEVHESHYRLEWMEDPWEDVEDSGEWLLALEEEFQPDIIHLNQYAHAALPWKHPVLVVAHSDVFSWFRAVRGREPGPEWSRYFHEVRSGLQAADRVVAPSRSAAADVLREYGRLPPLTVIPNGRRLDDFHPRPKDPIILSVGRLWDEAKNIGALCSIAQTLDGRVQVAGSFETPDGWAAKLEGVQHLGELPATELALRLGHAAIYALPAKYEPFGLSVLEAASAGCALVLGDIPSLRENWDGVARFVDPSEPEDLKLQLARLLREEHDRQSLALAARERSKQFSIRRTSDSYLSLYSDLRRAHFSRGIH
jgi:glycogen(starch) synthase